MRNGFSSEHWDDANGKPAGGITQGLGFVISWQNGPLGACTCPKDNVEIAHAAANGVHLRGICERKQPNGAFVETVIASVVDRLEHYEAGEFASDYNAEAIVHLNEALRILNERTAAREARGVEGTHAR